MKIIKEKHISLIKRGDTILHNGDEKTLTREHIKRGGFMGTTIWGDSYRAGSQLVKVVTYELDPS